MGADDTRREDKADVGGGAEEKTCEEQGRKTPGSSPAEKQLEAVEGRARRES